MKENQNLIYIIIIAVVAYLIWKESNKTKSKKQKTSGGGGYEIGWPPAYDTSYSDGEGEGEDGGEDEDPHIFIGGLKAPSVPTQQQQPITQVILQDDVATMETDNNYHTYTVYNNASVDNAETLSIGNTPQTTYSMRPLGATMYFVGKI